MNIKDIAKLANVSKSTVSRVLNDSQTVNATMRRRVLDVVKQTGYTPNALAKELVSKETKFIGVIVPRINTNVFSDMVEGITLTLSNFGYNVILLCSEANEEKELLNFAFLQKKQVDGIIFFPGNMTQRLIKTLKNLKTPLVMLGFDEPSVKKSAVIFDEKTACQTMVNHFLENGHKTIGFIGIDPSRSPVAQDRKEGYVQALKSYGLPIDKRYIYEGSFSLESGYHGACTILDQAPLAPTAIFAATDYLAIGAINCMRERNISVPQNLAIAGFDDIEISSYFHPKITSIHFDYFHSGEIAARFVLDEIKNEGSIKKRVLSFDIVYRESSKAKHTF